MAGDPAPTPGALPSGGVRPSRRLQEAVAGRAGLVAVVAAVAVGLGARAPLAWVDRHGGIDVALVCLVFASALTVAPAGWRRAGGQWRVLLAPLLAGVTILPALAWGLARFVGAGPLRDGVLAAGLAPCEIASVAATTMAGGDTALAAGMLVGSTVLTAALAGPLLSLEAGGAAVPTGRIVVDLSLVVVVPLVAALAVRAASPRTARIERPAGAVAAASVTVLVALVAAQVHLSSGYWPVALALGAFLLVSAALGWGLGRRRPGHASALLLTVSMRDFAVAAALASAAFGAAAAAPLGLYGVMVLGWGAVVAGRRRHEGKRRPFPNR